MSAPRLYIKFVPFNKHTIVNLINKTIKYSTVFEFNDLNEMKYIFHKFRDGKSLEYYKKKISKILEENHNVVANVIANITSLNDTRNITIEVKKKLLKFANKSIDSFEDSEFNLLVECIAYVSVGIFCMSDISVVDSDSAQLMFAHYADNLSGLGLLYEVADESKVHNISYRQRRGECSSQNIENIRNAIFSWTKGEFNEVSIYTVKSSKWQYEQECRMFNRPGIIPCKDIGLSLKAIITTKRFNENDMKILKKINRLIYEDQIRLMTVFPNKKVYEYRFDFIDNSTGVENSKWILANLNRFSGS